MTRTTNIYRTASATLSVMAALGLAMATPAPSIAADSTTGSSTAPAGYWLCYSRVAGYKWFEYSNCTGRSYKP